MKVTAIALASTEKAQWAFYERRFRPEEKVHQPWIDHNDQQAVGGSRFLDGLASRAETRAGWPERGSCPRPTSPRCRVHVRRGGAAHLGLCDEVRT